MVIAVSPRTRPRQDRGGEIGDSARPTTAPTLRARATLFAMLPATTRSAGASAWAWCAGDQRIRGRIRAAVYPASPTPPPAVVLKR